jgi:hypothetical protein
VGEDAEESAEDGDHEDIAEPLVAVRDAEDHGLRGDGERGITPERLELSLEIAAEHDLLAKPRRQR